MHEGACQIGVLSHLRKRTRVGAGLALVAMALQILCTFGHVHLAELSSAVSKSKALAEVSIAQGIAKAHALATIDDATPSPPASEHDLVCAFCLVGHLVASSVPAAPPVLVLPIAYLLLGPPLYAGVQPGVDAAASFWSRGPPHF